MLAMECCVLILQYLDVFVAHTADFYRRDETRQVRGGVQLRQATENRWQATITLYQTGLI